MSKEPVQSKDIKRIDIKEFRELGLLQEVNRLFFHPRGLALEVVVEDDGSERLGGVWDSREDPEGFMFGEEGGVERGKAARVLGMYYARRAARRQLFGTVDGIQPLPDLAGESTDG